MAKLDGDAEAARVMPPAGESYVEDLFRARYLEMVRLAGLLGADDPEDIAQEAFTRLMNKYPRAASPGCLMGYHLPYKILRDHGRCDGGEWWDGAGVAGMLRAI